MDQSTWRKITRYAVVVALVGVGYAMFPWGACTLTRAQEGGGPAGEAAAQCLEEHPLGERHLGWGVGLLAGLTALGAGVVGRRDMGSTSSIAHMGASDTMGADRRTGSARRMETKSRAAGSAGEVPEAITITQEFEIDLPDEQYHDEDVDALINYIEEEPAAGAADAPAPSSRAEQATDLDGFYCPPGLEGAPVLYVDPEHAGASDQLLDEVRADDPEQPFRTITAALKHAGQLNMGGGKPVQVRVQPGVYQESLVVPAGVSLVNHRLPAEGSVRQHLEWLVDQDEVDHPDRVTILAPSDADYAVRLERGRNAGVFGCHLVGREGVDQRGIVAEDVLSAAIVNCAIEDFSAGGVRLERCGGSIAQTAVRIVGCRLRNNEAARGGAVLASGGTLIVEKTRMEKNRAQLGGALLADGLTGPLQLIAVGFRRNAARSEDRLTVRPDVVRLEDWQHGTGQGGALAVVRSKAKLTDCKFIENRAKISGGAAAFLGAQVVLSARGSGNSFKHNKARVGGGAFMAGWLGCRATLKASGTKLIDNTAGSDGGALAVLGLSVAQIIEAKFCENRSQEADGVGGAVCCLKGGQFMAKETEFRANTSAGDGGAVAAVNASLVLSDGCTVEDNAAEAGDGGGVCCLSRSDADMEQLMGHTDFKLPFVFTTRKVTVRNNRADGRGGGVWVGNREELPTFPVKVTVQKPARMRSNAPEDLVVVWTGEQVRLDGETLLN